MNLISGLLAAATIVFWGASGFVDKLVTNHLGSKGAVFWLLASLSTLLVAFLMALNGERFGYPGYGFWFLVLSVAFNLVGTFAFFLLMSRAEASFVIPLTSLYPVISVILAVLILKEAPTITRIVGIIFSFLAIFFLSL